jgi:ABC-type molybdenum transport system ATPase subunit/photorepair protein PhrA
MNPIIPNTSHSPTNKKYYKRYHKTDVNKSRHQQFMQQLQQLQQTQQINHIQQMQQLNQLQQSQQSQELQKMLTLQKQHTLNPHASPFTPKQNNVNQKEKQNRIEFINLDIADVIKSDKPCNCPSCQRKRSHEPNKNQMTNIIDGQNMMSNKSEKNNSNRLEDVFRALLGLQDTGENDETDEETTKLKVKTFDLTAEYEEIPKKISTIDDLIELSKLYDETKPELMNKYTFDLKRLVAMKEPLIELKNMIGMESVKKSIVRQILYFLQSIEEQQDMLHVVITGSPGTGKTSLGVILAKLYHAMGIIDSKTSTNPLTGKPEDFTFKIYKRADLIGQYLGHTAIKTQKAIDECLGGVMFLDEAYSLGHDEKSDIYTKECVDTINQNLSENKKKFILIIAGYAEQLDKCFFAHNEGLKRRFAFRYDIEKYTLVELSKMLELKIKLSGWNLDSTVGTKDILNIIDGSENMFKNFGGDIESWLFHIKIEHGMRIFGKHPKLRKILILNDLKNGLDQFKIAKENKIEKNKSEMDKIIASTLYI